MAGADRHQTGAATLSDLEQVARDPELRAAVIGQSSAALSTPLNGH